MYRTVDEYVALPQCRQAIREGLFTEEWLSSHTPEILHWITKEDCINGLRGSPPILNLQVLEKQDSNRIGSISSPECIQAIKDKLFTLEWVSGLTTYQLWLVTSRFCLEAMRSMPAIFTKEILKKMDPRTLEYCIRPENIKAIQMGIYDLEWLSKKTPRELAPLSRPATIEALYAEPPIITGEDLKRIDEEKLGLIATTECISAINDGIFTLRTLCELTAHQLHCITQEHFIKAMRAEPPIFKMTDLGTLWKIEGERLAFITSPTCIKAIQEGLFTVEWLSNLSAQQLRYITNDKCIAAMKAEPAILTPTALAAIENPKNLELIIRPGLIQGVKDGLFTLAWLGARTPEQLSAISEDTCLAAMRCTPPVLTPENLAGIQGNKIHWISKPTCIRGIQEGLYPLSWLSQLDLGHLNVIASEPALLDAMRSHPEIFTLKKLAAIKDRIVLYSIIQPGALQAMQEGLFSFDWLSTLSSPTIGHLTNEICLQAMRQTPMILSEAALKTLCTNELYSIDKLYFISRPECVKGIIDGLFSFEWLAEQDIRKLNFITQDIFINELRNGVTTIEQLTAATLLELQEMAYRAGMYNISSGSGYRILQR